MSGKLRVMKNMFLLGEQRRGGDIISAEDSMRIPSLSLSAMLDARELEYVDHRDQKASSQALIARVVELEERIEQLEAAFGELTQRSLQDIVKEESHGASS